MTSVVWPNWVYCVMAMHIRCCYIVQGLDKSLVMSRSGTLGVKQVQTMY